ncbi:LuxR C-terminal-related transcriptional regulator [Kitasatospora sp. LaBMicrA B282]|uniref:LuxR C-terminal-related transcriptional regulator n=1 Tax=Kitasatospora sp. LaBMicrA B282 TaxID=3420949 RepID=UPI003D0FAD60
MVGTDTLVGLGLEQDTARVWQAMLDRPEAGVDDLAALLGATTTEVMHCLGTLAELALIRASMENPQRLVPVAAEAGLELLLRRQEEQLAEQRRQVEAKRDLVTAMITAGMATGGRTPELEHLVGLDVIQARFEQLAYSIRETADSMFPGTAFPAEMLEAARPLDEEVLDRGVRMRSLYQTAIHNDPTTLGYTRAMAARGAEVRTAPVLGQRLWLGDGRIAIVPLEPGNPRGGAVVVTAPGVIASLSQLFEHTWSSAAPLVVGNPVEPATGLTDTERELLTMLAGGLTDEAAGKRLGVSLRTVRRMMADLMARLDAGSRFEAGIKAAKRGWL